MEQNTFYIQLLAESLKAKQLVEKRNFSLRALAARINLSHSMLSQILSGKKRPGMALFQRLCEELEVPSDQKLLATDSLIKSSNRMKKYYQVPVQAEALPELAPPVEQ